MSGRLNLAYQPPGPVAAAFLKSRAPVKMIMGPVGSGKTSAALMKTIDVLREQRPSVLDGVKRCKFAVIRDTYRNLEKTTIPSWHSWVPPTVGRWNGEAPMTHEITFVENGVRMELIVEFIALGENRVEDVTRGLEITGAYINEADRLPPETLTHVRSRCGRYPNASHGGPTWRGVWLDMNAPDTENWTYKTFVEDKPDEFEFYRQPSGFSPAHENAAALAQISSTYYQDLAAGQPDWWVRRFIRNEWGYSREGLPVYGEFNDAWHVAGEELQPVPDLPLIVGADAGLFPAAVLTQRMPNGQRRILDELVASNMGAKRFGQQLNDVLASPKYRHCRQITATGDPAAAARSPTDEQNWFDVMISVTKLKWRLAPTNKLQPRLEAVRQPLGRMIDGAPGFLLSPTCKVLRKGFNAGYRLRRINVVGGGAEKISEEPEKNEFSHPHDALQYAMLEDGGFAEISGRDRRRRDARQQTRAVTEDRPYGEFAGDDGRTRRDRQRRAVLD